MWEALQESQVSTCGDATPLGSIGAVDIAMVMPNATQSRSGVVLRAFLSCLQCPYVVVRRTDILMGVHGAGLTHGMFIPPGSAIVEILPPGVTYKGFRDMAKPLGHNHFSSHATGRPGQTVTGDWIKSMYLYSTIGERTTRM
jgi:hypothetical protein